MEKAQIEKLSPNQRSRIRNGKGCKCKMAGEGVPSDDVMLSHGNFQKLVKGAAKNKPVVLTLSGGEIEANATTGTGIMEGGKLSLYRKDLGLGKTGKKINKALGRVAEKAVDKAESKANEKIDGGKFSLYRKDLGLGKTGKKMSKALGRVANKAVDKAESMANEKIDGGKFSLYRKDLGLGKTGRKMSKALGRVADKAIEKGESSANDRIASMGSGMSGGSIGPRRSSVAPNIGAGGNLLCPMDSKPHLANFHMFTQLPPALVPSGMFGRGLYH